MAQNSDPERPKRKRGPGRPFPKGVSGNPGGRPKALSHLRALAQQHDQLAIDALVAVLKDKKAPAIAKVAASKELFDRGYGKPAQVVEVPEGANAQLLPGVIVLPAPDPNA